MAFAVVCGLDSESEAKVREIWQSLADAHISSQFIDNYIDPHVVLARCEALNVETVGRSIKSLASSTPAITTHFHSIGLFPGAEGTLFLTPAVTYELLILHAEVHEDLDDYGVVTSEDTAAGRWLPRCTLASQLSQQGIADTVTLLHSMALPIPIQFTSLGIIEFGPALFKWHGRYDLSQDR